ncbi:flagellar basal body-associated FliL family protein [Desulfoplanes formicivorans]|uniref:Flagellar protein FliL n=1 Tax=Desulfoplanes formicivorans TaxID=1592317 RepID=A0A194AGD1_9BACT|nr:flagellar basal body-associated FliL family protein [Desulfoplanes formicivorans]GAU08383.1 flagellar basal body protein FliL [Desulfoplanes formicivorans]
MINKEVEAPVKKKSGLLKWLILLLLLLGVGAGGFFAYQHFVGMPVGNPADQSAVPDGSDPASTQAPEEVGSQPQLFSMPPFVVNLADPLGRRYLKLSLEIEVKNKSVLEKTEKAMPRIKDALLLLLSSKSYSDLASMENKIALKNEIISRLGQIVGNGNVSNVYFTEFIIQ